MLAVFFIELFISTGSEVCRAKTLTICWFFFPLNALCVPQSNNRIVGNVCNYNFLHVSSTLLNWNWNNLGPNHVLSCQNCINATRHLTKILTHSGKSNSASITTESATVDIIYACELIHQEKYEIIFSAAFRDDYDAPSA